MKINEDLIKKINALGESKSLVLTLLLEDIENELALSRIEERLRSEIREIIKEGELI